MDKAELKQTVKEAVAEVLAQQKTDTMALLSAYESKSYPVTFYNPAISSFGMSISVARASVQIYMAAPIDKNARGFAKPGEKRYDHLNPFIFGLTIHECFLIQENFDALVNGTWERYQDPGKPPIDEKYKHVMEFQHKTRKFFVGPIMDRSQRKTLRIGVYDPDRSGSLSYILRPENGELKLFRTFMANAITLLPFMIALVGGVVKNFKSAIYEVGTKNGKNGVTNSPNGHSSDNSWGASPAPVSNDPWNTPSTPDSDDPWSSSAPVQQPAHIQPPQNNDPFDGFGSPVVPPQQSAGTINPENVDWGF